MFAVQGYGVLSTPPAYSGVIYYSKGDNVVHYYNPSNQTEKKNMISIPADEEIVYIAHSSDPSTVTPVDVFTFFLTRMVTGYCEHIIGRERLLILIRRRFIPIREKGSQRISFIEIRVLASPINLLLFKIKIPVLFK